MKIDLLKNHPQHIPTLAAWFKDESPDYFRGKSLAAIAEGQFVPRLNDQILPISFIAYEEDFPLGTIALLEESVTTHKHLGPWLGGLHVHPQFRHQGVGLKLVRAGVAKAAALGFSCLYAGVSKAQDRYISSGWRVFGTVTYYGKPLSILRIDLAGGDVQREV